MGSFRPDPNILKKHPNAAQWFALGNEVDVVIDDTLVMVR